MKAWIVKEWFKQLLADVLTMLHAILLMLIFIALVAGVFWLGGVVFG